ncbi:hypothetical protein QJS10_CPA08g00467 [Acorus calamus]|uniref:C2H2-type domain-containing protein n=1 Tax=Acorus calamus TaxID=4465 RepID=A0AAV9EEL1_ACOCL|nr:hypothetical protein QJS10_CPA08g00467 [Acorus calamus]
MEEDKSLSAMVVSRTPSLTFDSLYGHSKKLPLAEFPTTSKKKRGSRKPRQDFFFCYSESEEVLNAATCLFMISRTHPGEYLEQINKKRRCEEMNNNNHHEALAMPEEEEEKKRLYWCVTCGKAFTTFQALGGHCTYHNRMDRKSAVNNNAEECPTTETRMSKKNHECSVCREVFTSGQALGGHMRKHYNARLAKVETRRPAPQFLFDLNLPAMPEY